MRNRGSLGLILILSLFLAALGTGCRAEPVATFKTKEARATDFPGRAVSLKILQERLKAFQRKGSCDKSLHRLAGINRVEGVIVDEENQDLILYGAADANSPPLYLEDFVVALRNTWLKYAILKDNTYYYSYPGCSIDPDPRVIGKLQTVHQQILDSSSSGDIERYIEEWHSVCRSPQQVRVMGIPFDTRFASVLVKADYDMKGLADGYDSIDIPGFISHTGIILEKVKSYIIKDQPISIPLSSINRFWFYPGENLYLEDEGVVTIKRSQIILLTEEEHLAGKEKIVGKGHPNPLAQEFAENFTAKYAEIAKQRPIYHELESLFRFVALARIIKFRSLDTEAGLDLSYLLDHYPLPKTDVSRHLEGRSTVEEYMHRRKQDGGHLITQLWLPSCGGVTMAIRITQDNFMKDTSNELSSLKTAVLKTRPSPDALAWNLRH